MKDKQDVAVILFRALRSPKDFRSGFQHMEISGSQQAPQIEADSALLLGLQKRILILRFSSLSDIVLVTPVFARLKERYPESEITFLTGSSFVSLFADDRRLSAVTAVELVLGSGNHALFGEQWDLVIDLQNDTISRSLTGRLRILGSIARFHKLRWSRLLLLFARISTYRRESHLTERFLQAAGAFTPDQMIPSPRLYFASCARPALDVHLPAGLIVRPVIMIFPFSMWRNKEWPMEYYAQVGRFFLTKGWNVLIMAGPNQRKRSEYLRSLVGNRCVSLAGKISLYECGCVLNKCALALGNDTGLSYLARACGVRTGIIYGPTTRDFGCYPSGDPPFEVFESSLACRPCHTRGGNICLRATRHCLRSISIERVIVGMEILFHRKSSAHTPSA